MKPRSIYIHVPFCARRCSYCDFAVQATREPPVSAWIEAVGTEIRKLAADCQWDAPLELDTLYVGGGTPSLLGTGAMSELGARLRPLATWHAERIEWTCEANPESFTPALAADWRSAGVNRVSLGVQTFHAPSLRWMGRLHGTEGPSRAMQAAREAGFDNVSIDLIFGLPERLERDWGADLVRALDLEPDHVSLYGLTAEPGAPLGRWVREGRERLPVEDRYAEEYLLAHERLTAAGFEHYEVSNFARPGYSSRHNTIYWSGLPYVGLGPSSHGYDPPRRYWNLRTWDAYRRAVTAGRPAVEGEEVVSPEEAALEWVWLSLRTQRGIALPEDGDGGGKRRMAEEWIRRGWAVMRNAHLVLTARGWLLLDRLALDYASA